jgi:hypothetical protein
MKVMIGFTPPPAIALGLKPQATVSSESARNKSTADSFTPSTPTSKGMRSGFLHIDGERFEGTASEYLKKLKNPFFPVLNEEGKIFLGDLVKVCESHSDEHLNHSVNTTIFDKEEGLACSTAANLGARADFLYHQSNEDLRLRNNGTRILTSTHSIASLADLESTLQTEGVKGLLGWLEKYTKRVHEEFPHIAKAILARMASSQS